jgi:hypothetical protein
MASLYQRGDRIWMNFRDVEGKWKNRSTGYRWNNVVEMRLAKKACGQQSLKERVSARTMSGSWDWVAQWIESTWSGPTLRRYHQLWQALAGYLKEAPVSGPANLSRDHCLVYVSWRERRGGGRNSAALELRFLGQVMDEATRRGMAERNPARNLRIKQTPSKEKSAWTDAELAMVDSALVQAEDKYGWMRVSFLLGRFQASRLGQSVVPLSAIDLQRNVIHWPSAVVKGGKAFSQPIVDGLKTILADIVEYRRTHGHTALADLPQLPSLEWRKFLDSLGLRHLSHHGLRVSWVTKAAMAGIPEAVAQRFSNHSSTAVHRIYMRFSTSDMSEMLKRLG